jgi:hypothetical protein
VNKSNYEIAHYIIFTTYLSYCGLFYDAILFIVHNGWIIDKWKGFRRKWSWFNWSTIMARFLGVEGLRKTMKSLSQDSWCPSHYLNRAPPKYKSRVLLLHKPAWYYTAVIALSKNIFPNILFLNTPNLHLYSFVYFILN